MVSSVHIWDVSCHLKVVPQFAPHYLLLLGIIKDDQDGFHAIHTGTITPSGDKISNMKLMQFYKIIKNGLQRGHLEN